MNIKSALKYGYISLAKSTKIPHLEAEILLAKSMSSIREFILSHSDEEIMMATQKKYLSDIKKRNSGFPLAYLTGKKEFYGLEFFVNQNVLIPRPQTELIIDEVINLTYNNDYKFSIIDVGTGSGCIIITLAKLLKQNNFYGIDISNKALRVARKNAKLNKVTNIKFLRGNLLQPFLNSKFKIQNSKLVIIANLPYLTVE
ncbi:MAG: peptide chain release factor N(5)-glutamine methyltransferase, partial [Candidatus Falkowbacteria bacterium]|nr:peptide chain release factor N(5)-glutamine methyltransferase [Candidatus Falkowbacteria bacterium]